MKSFAITEQQLQIIYAALKNVSLEVGGQAFLILNSLQLIGSEQNSVQQNIVETA